MEFFNGVATSSLGASLATSVGSSISSVWFIVLIAVGLPLSFWVIHKVIGLFPKAR